MKERRIRSYYGNFHKHVLKSFLAEENKYQLLINTLDSLINEAPDELTRYDTSNEETTNQARARALIHLFLRTK